MLKKITFSLVCMSSALQAMESKIDVSLEKINTCKELLEYTLDPQPTDAAQKEEGKTADQKRAEPTSSLALLMNKKPISLRVQRIETNK